MPAAWAKEGSAARNFLISAMVWLLVAMVVGLIAGFQLVYPDMLRNVLPESLKAMTTFGRLRPLHTNGALFGWLLMATFGAHLYIVPKLCRTRLYSEKLGNLTMVLFNVAIIWAAIALLTGQNQGKEYAELPWALDMLIVVIWVLQSVNIFATIARRKDKEMYVSLWYVMASLIWGAVIYTIGNKIWDPLHNGAYQGISDAIVGGFYIHNAVGMIFTPAGLAVAYYLIPLVAGRPIFGHRVSMAGFWLLAIAYPPIGVHHIILGPIPYWLESVSIAGGIGLIFAVWTVLYNWFKTMQAGGWMRTLDSVPGKFLLAGGIFYFITCLEGPLHGLRSMQNIIHFTHWVVGHAHTPVLGAFSFFAWAFLYWGLPRLTGRMIYSNKLAHWHFWLTTLGVMTMTMALRFAGVVQGTMWANGASFYSTLAPMKIYNLMRAISGTVIIVGQLVMVYNIYQTMRSAKTTHARNEISHPTTIPAANQPSQEGGLIA